MFIGLFEPQLPVAPVIGFETKFPPDIGFEPQLPPVIGFEAKPLVTGCRMVTAPPGFTTQLPKIGFNPRLPLIGLDPHTVQEVEEAE